MTLGLRKIVFSLLVAMLMLAAFGCDEQSQISADNGRGLSPQQAYTSLQRVSQDLETSQGRLMLGIIVALVVIGVLLPGLFWWRQRNYLARQESRLTAALCEREDHIEAQFHETEKRLCDDMRKHSETWEQQLHQQVGQVRQQTELLEKNAHRLFQTVFAELQALKTVKKTSSDWFKEKWQQTKAYFRRKFKHPPES